MKKATKQGKENKVSVKDGKKFLVKKENLPKSSLKLVFNIPWSEFEKFYNQGLQEAGKELKVPGFRKGKIPKEIVEKELGKESALYHGADVAIKKIYVDTIINENIPAIGEPKVDIVTLKKGENFEFVAIVDLLPEVEIGDFQKEVEKINEKFVKQEVKVNSEMIKKELDVLANQRVKVVTVNRGAKKGDQVEVDFKVLVNNVVIEGGTAKKQMVVLGAGRFIPGFEEQLIGMKANEEKEFDLKFPKDYHIKHLAEKKAKFQVKVNLVQERELPKVDDDFAKSFGKFKSLQELKDNIKDGLKHEEEHKKEEQWKKEIIDVLLSKTKAEIPESLIEKEVEVMMRELENDVARLGLKKEDYFRQIKTGEEELKKEWRKKQAPDRVTVALILQKLARENKLEPNKKDIQAGVDNIVQRQAAFGQDIEKLDLQRIYEAVKGSLTNEEVFKWLMGGDENLHKCKH